ncbi:50S ribosomal protein L24 [Paraglaciecola aquimarina]|uniref:Large ribosomal subunit protein uL24 n=1 Tax=Paraglaciecola aquimarina TaxID=1235557 RepID=A0ABU3SRP0_9ALTE|nr:50S ribosomal protein L24 [Paraglaciecola aquimarina]MDU0352656.1 50S ribosomal protein L24 [Paraglaciecola aquimarina]
MANKIRRDDEIIVLAGKDKGKQGKVLKVIPAANRLIVEGVNLIKKHQKPNPQLGEAGGVIEKEASIHVSNVAIYNSKTGKADRVGFRLEGEKKVRFFKSDGELV